MRVRFEVKDLNDGPYAEPKELPRRLYKGLITRLNREGRQFRVGTLYQGAVITKTLTILVPIGATH